MSDPASLIAQAEKLLKARSGAFSFFSGSSSDKTEEAVELFKKAGFGYRSRKEYRNSGKVYDRAAEVAEDVFEKVRSSKEASKSYKMGDRDGEFAFPTIESSWLSVRGKTGRSNIGQAHWRAHVSWVPLESAF